MASAAGDSGNSKGNAPGKAPPHLSYRSSSRGAQHPGIFLESRFLQPLSVSQAELARAIGVSRRRINELVVGKRSITPDTAIKLARYFGTDPEFWLSMQMHWDLRQALQKERKKKENNPVKTTL